MRKTLLVLITLALGAPAWGLELAGFTIGGNLKDADGAGLDGCRDSVCTGKPMLGDFQSKMTLTTDADGKIEWVNIVVPSGQADLLLRAAVAKYGKPTASRAPTVQNAFGAKFRNEYAIWQRKDGTVVFFERCAGKLDESCLSALAPGFKMPDKKMQL